MASLEDVGAVPGGGPLRQFLQVSLKDDGTLVPAQVQTAIGGSLTAVDGQVWTPLIARMRGRSLYAQTRNSLDLGPMVSGVMLRKRGILAENFPVHMMNGTNAPTTQTVYGMGFTLLAGTVVTGIVHRDTVAAAGTNPTTVRFCLADATGKILALSGNYGTGGTNNATTIFAAGPNGVPLSTPYTIPVDGDYLAAFLVNGTWGTTQPLLGRATGVSTAALGAFNGGGTDGFIWTGQTDLPAVGSSMTITSVTSFLSFYMGIY